MAAAALRREPFDVHAATNGKRNKNLFGGAADSFKQGSSLLMRRGDIEKNNFVGPSMSVNRGQFCGISGIAEV